MKNSHRLLVRGTRIETEAEPEEKPEVYVPNEAMMIDSFIVIPFVAVPMLLMLTVIIFVISRLRR